MRFTHFIFLLYIFIFFGCKEDKPHLTKIVGTQIQITDSLTPNSAIESYIKPYKNRIEKDLDSVLAYAIKTYSKKDGDFNTALGNFIADAVYTESNAVFKQRTGKTIDMVILNHGGIRSILSQGNVTKRSAFKLMPFENSIVVVALKGHQIDSIAKYLKKSRRAHPISKLKLVLDKNFNILETSINNKPIDKNKTYYVATNDYLYNGGDHMTFFKPNDSVYVLNYKLRNALIDNFKKIDTIKPIIDDRFTQKK